jgi:hypothetical protein
VWSWTSSSGADATRASERPVRLAYQPSASSIFLSEQINHQQPASSTFLSQQINTGHQPPTKRTDCRRRTRCLRAHRKNSQEGSRHQLPATTRLPVLLLLASGGFIIIVVSTASNRLKKTSKKSIV